MIPEIWMYGPQCTLPVKKLVHIPVGLFDLVSVKPRLPFAGRQTLCQ